MEQIIQLIQGNGQLVEARLCSMEQQHLSESFYEHQNMLNLGYNDDREMIYFEYGPLNRPRSWEANDAL